jgi:hypothetical protein
VDPSAGTSSEEKLMAVRDTVTVTCNTPVSGARRVRRRGEYRLRSGHVHTWRVEPDVLAAARAVCRPGEHLVFVSPTRVDIVYDD